MTSFFKAVGAFCKIVYKDMKPVVKTAIEVYIQYRLQGKGK